MKNATNRRVEGDQRACASGVFAKLVAQRSTISVGVDGQHGVRVECT